MGIRNIDFSDEEYYHIYNRAVEKRKIFIDEGDHRRLVSLLYTSNSTTPVHLSNFKGVALPDIPRGETIVSIGAWCIMPNHFHLLIRAKKGENVSTFMSKMLTGYSMYFNTKYHRKGTLFDRPFKARHLNTDEYLKYQFAYIHLNPVGIIDKGWKEKKLGNRAVAEKFLQSYEYSSYQEYADHTTKRSSSLILDRKDFPTYFSRPHDFTSMVHEWLNFEDTINIKETP